MSEWKSFCLGEVATFKTGKLNSNAAEKNGKYPFFTCAPEPLKINSYSFDQQAILLAGNNAEGNFHIKYYEGKFDAYQRTYVFSARPSFHLKFLYYSIKLCLENFKRISVGTATKFLTAKILNGFTIPCPPLDTQKKIAAVLSALDDKIELNNAINKNLEEQAQAIYKNMFVDNFNPEWKRGTIENLSQNIVCGKTPSTKCAEYYGGNIPFITIPDMHNMVYVVDTERYLSSIGAISQSNKFLPVNSICVSCIGTAGLVSLTSRDSQTNQQINSIIPKKKISPYYVYYLMKSLCEKIIKLGSCGSTIVNLNKGQFSRIEVTIPPDDVMYLFNERVTFIFKMILSNIQENQKLGELRDALLPRLMSGEIDVSKVEIFNEQ